MVEWTCGIYILVVQNGVGSGAIKTILLTLITVAIFFATISTAINYAQGFNDRILNWYQKRKQGSPGSFRGKEKQAGSSINAGLYCVYMGSVPDGTDCAGIEGTYICIDHHVVYSDHTDHYQCHPKVPDADYAHMTKEK